MTNSFLATVPISFHDLDDWWIIEWVQWLVITNSLQNKGLLSTEVTRASLCSQRCMVTIKNKFQIVINSDCDVAARHEEQLKSNLNPPISWLNQSDALHIGTKKWNPKQCSTLYQNPNSDNDCWSKFCSNAFLNFYIHYLLRCRLLIVL